MQLLCVVGDIKSKKEEETANKKLYDSLIPSKKKSKNLSCSNQDSNLGPAVCETAVITFYTI